MKQKLDPKRCSEQVYDRGMRFPRPHQCSRLATVQENGKGWCKQHAPSAAKARREKTFATSSEKFDRLSAQWRLESSAPLMLDALKAWLEMDRESPDKNPCPDPVLRHTLREIARRKTDEAIRAAEGDK